MLEDEDKMLMMLEVQSQNGILLNKTKTAVAMYERTFELKDEDIDAQRPMVTYANVHSKYYFYIHVKPRTIKSEESRLI